MLLGALLGGWVLIVAGVSLWSVRRCRMNRAARERALDRWSDLK